MARPMLPLRAANARLGTGARAPLLARSSENLALKLVAILTSVILFYYVRTDKPASPQATTQLQAPLTLHHVPPDIEVDSADKYVPVHITGPRILVDSLRDTDVRADVDLAGVAPRSGRTEPLRVIYSVPSLSGDSADQLRIEGPVNVRLLLYAHATHEFPVEVRPSHPPAGFNYGRPQVEPPMVKCSGREDRIDQVAHVLAAAAPSADGQILGSFPIAAYDADNNLVSDVTLSPPSVRVAVPLLEDPPARFVTVSPNITAVPLPPYRLVGLDVLPQQVKVVGPPGQVESIYTLQTEPVSLRKATEDQQMKLALILPPGVTAFGPQGDKLTAVVVTAHVGLEPSPGTTQAPPGAH